MSFELLKFIKEHEISVFVFLALLCFVISLCFFGRELPGGKILLSESLQRNNMELRKKLHLYKDEGPYRISSFYESKGTNNFRPDLHFKIIRGKDVILYENRKTNAGSGGRDGSIYWGYNDYGLFELPGDGNYELIIEAVSYPREFKNLNLFISQSASNFWRNFFICTGVVLFLIVAIRRGRTRVRIR